MNYAVNCGLQRLAKKLLVIISSVYLFACAGQSGDPHIDHVQAAKTRVSLGLTYLKNGNFQQAKVNLDRALNFAPDLPDTHFAMAYYYQTVDEHRLAEAAYLQALDIDDSNPEVLNAYGAFLCQQRRFQQAQTILLQAVNTVPYAHGAATYENMAICARDEGRNVAAISHLKSALKHDPNRLSSADMLLPLALAEQQWQDARMALHRIEQLASVSSETIEKAMIIEYNLGNIAAARDFRDTLLRLYPEHQMSAAMPMLDSQPAGGVPASRQDSGGWQQHNSPPAQGARSIDSAPLTLEKQGLSDTLHIVTRGDNLFRISLKYRVKMQQLMEWNNLSDSARLFIGQRLHVSKPNPNQLETK